MRQHLIRNIFDQYKQQENRLTHALVQVLAQNASLAREFLRGFVGGFAPAPEEEILISCQRFPGQESEPLTEEQALQREGAGRGIPDFWMYWRSAADGSGWAVACECKVVGSPSLSQLRSHIRRGHSQGFRNLEIVTITPDPIPQQLFRHLSDARVVSKTWTDVYQFFRRHSRSPLVADFLDFIMGEYSMQALKFPGIPFGTNDRYDETAAKRPLRALMRELRPRLEASKVLTISSETARKPITGPWDVVGFSFAASDDTFTKYPHITVSLEPGGCGVQITLPNNAKSVYWKRVRSRGNHELLDTLREVANDLGPRKPLERGLLEPNLTLCLEQVHFYAMKYRTRDAQMIFDVSTILGGQPEGHIRPVGAWLSALSSILGATTQANFQLSLKVQYPYANGSACRNEDFVDVLVKSRKYFCLDSK